MPSRRENEPRHFGSDASEVGLRFQAVLFKREKMMRLMATRLAVLTIVIVGATGCGGGAADRDEPAASDTVSTSQALLDCTTYDGYTAALAEATIECTGTIGPNSFAVDLLSGLLGRRFSACTVPGAVDSLLLIDRLLSLQLRLDLSLANVCIAKA